MLIVTITSWKYILHYDKILEEMYILSRMQFNKVNKIYFWQRYSGDLPSNLKWLKILIQNNITLVQALSSKVPWGKV